MPFKPIDVKPQKELLLDHFKTDPTITGIKASGMYRIRDLPKRISELRAEGHIVIVTRKVDPRGQRYNEYRYGGFKPMSQGLDEVFGGEAPKFLKVG
jgi:hypothetical protein